MRRFLVVGCGGSGAVTLSYMMDQLRSDLAAVGVDKIPSGWQFVSLDVPTAPESGPDGLNNVRDQGGSYFGSGPQGDSYAVLDNALSNQLTARQQLSSIATWAPRDPRNVPVPIGSGAGQFRALGRMITLSKTTGISEVLQRAWDTLFTVSTETEMRSLNIPGGGSFDPGEAPIVLVVSSMAGGAGASMALDICRLLTLIPRLDPRMMGVFMVAPDIFDGLGKSATTGVSANALAMLGEIVASQMGSARDHDVTILKALGQQNGEGAEVPFARVFPVGRRVGTEGAPFGDGSQNAIYRGLGRGLSGLMMSGAATRQFIQYDLTNGGGLAGLREHIGWGAGAWDSLPWGTFGFSSLSMGRDRYAEYSAQRLARSSVDRLLDGHLQRGNPASDEEQVNGILDSQWPSILARVGLADRNSGGGASPANVSGWITGTVLPWEEIGRMSRQIVESQLRPYIPSGDGMNAKQWVPDVQMAIRGRSIALRGASDNAALLHAFGWQDRIVHNIESMVSEAICTLGLPYATAIVNRLAAYLRDIIRPAAEDLAKLAPADISAPTPGVTATLASLNGTIPMSAAVIDSVVAEYQGNVSRQIYSTLSGKVRDIAAALVPEIMTPLLAALNESQTVLRIASKTPAVDVGLARLETDQYAAWPSDAAERVPQRFAEANNEVMLTPSAEFLSQYRSDLPMAVAEDSAVPPPFETAVQIASQRVVTGLWPTTDGSRAPGQVVPLIERTATWRSKAFPVNPSTNEALIPSAARYDIHLRGAELLNRARAYVSRTGESFDRFCKVTLRDYIVASGVPEYELSQRTSLLLSKFGEALSLARPLASVNQQAMEALHPGQQIAYRYKFSAVPFLNLPVSDLLAQVISHNPKIDRETGDGFGRVLTDEGGLKRLDIFGSYPNYSPLAYDSVLKPAAKQWADSTPSQQEAFWSMRRSRPLAASLPMHENERRAMTAGWFLGLVLGRIRIPAPPFLEPVRVWSAADSAWLDFPNPLLTPPARFGANNDWLPAVLESVLLAMAQSHQQPVMSSMYPYRALRSIYDATLEDPARGINEISAKAALTEWLRTGETQTGWPSAVPESDGVSTIKERSAKAVEWLDRLNAFAGHHYMAPGEDGAAGGGTFSLITSRGQASKTPIFRDLAPDVFWATAGLSTMVKECEEAAMRPVHSGIPTMPSAGFGDNDIVIPDLGQF